MAHWIEDTLEEHPWTWMALFLGALAMTSVGVALRRPLWVDEVFAYYLARQPSMGDAIRAIGDGCDNLPPANVLLLRGLRAILGDSVLVMRIPEIAGFCLMGACLFAFLRRRLPALYAAIATLIACNAALPFATEARPYACVLGCAALALVCWQAAAEGRGRHLALLGLTLSLALGIMLHYYTICLLGPLLVGEFFRWLDSRKVDWRVIGALAIAPLVLIPHMALIRASKMTMHYWGQTGGTSLMDTYHVFFERSLWYAGIAALAAGLLFAREEDRGPHPDSAGMRGPEMAVCGFLALLPAILWAVSRFTTLPAFPRYAISAVIGVGVVTATSLFRISPRNPTIAAAVLIAMAGFLAKQTASYLLHPEFKLSEGTQAMRGSLAQIPPDPSPIVVEEDHDFLELGFSATPEVRSRLVFLVDANLSLKYTGTDAPHPQISPWRNRLPFAIRENDEFLTFHPHFFLVHNPQRGWLLWHLARSGYRVTPADDRKPPILFEVELGRP
jgi:hypothetical protein